MPIFRRWSVFLHAVKEEPAEQPNNAAPAEDPEYTRASTEQTEHTRAHTADHTLDAAAEHTLDVTAEHTLLGSPSAGVLGGASAGVLGRAEHTLDATAEQPLQPSDAGLLRTLQRSHAPSQRSAHSYPYVCIKAPKSTRQSGGRRKMTRKMGSAKSTP